MHSILSPGTIALQLTAENVAFHQGVFLLTSLRAYKEKGENIKENYRTNIIYPNSEMYMPNRIYVSALQGVFGMSLCFRNNSRNINI